MKTSDVLMTTKFSLKGIFRRFRGKILFTFLLLLIENIFIVMQPFCFGMAINDLLSHSFRGVLYVIGLYAGSLLIGVGRRMYDTRTYSAIYAAMASETVDHQKSLQTPLSAIVTRGHLVKELVDFFEHDMTQGFTSTMKVLGAVVMLAVFDLRLFAGCVGAVVLIYLVYLVSEKTIFQLNQSLNDELERQVDVISSSPQSAIIKHFKGLAKWQVKLSDREAINFGLIELILFTLILMSLFIAVQGDNPTPGGIFAILAYVLEFAEGIYMLPWIFQQLIRLKEISQRLQGEA